MVHSAEIGGCDIQVYRRGRDRYDVVEKGSPAYYNTLKLIDGYDSGGLEAGIDWVKERR